MQGGSNELAKKIKTDSEGEKGQKRSLCKMNPVRAKRETSPERGSAEHAPRRQLICIDFC